MKKRILCFALTLVMLLGCVAMFASCGECTNHVDPDGDGKCNNCGVEISAACNHADNDDDGFCDTCDEPMTSGVGTCAHDDVNGDKVCDLCGKDVTTKIEMKPVWNETTIIMQLNECSHKGELSSELRRYVAADTKHEDTVDKLVSKRNIAATKETKVKVDYKYWADDDNKNGWSKTIAHIGANITSTTLKDVPDVYSTYIYDLVGASVQGYFANLKGTSRALESNKNVKLNYFEFVYDKYNFEKEYNASKAAVASGEEKELVDRGFMYDWMESVTLDPDRRMYVLASDYYIDMVRAFFMIPVNVAILTDVANQPTNANLTGDRDFDGDIDLADFYAQVIAGEWTYKLMMDYAKAAYVDDGVDTTTGKWLGDTQVGFAMAAGGVATSGIIYTASIQHIMKEWDTKTNDYKYWYPENCNDYGKQLDAIEALLKGDGVVYVRDSDCTSTAWNSVSKFSRESHLMAIRVAFGQGSVLFGDIMMVGALEETQYQNMGTRAFGVVPVPIYHDNFDSEGNQIDQYLTQIHNVGRPGAIAYNSKKFIECTAYLNYQSTHSTDILNTYYKYNLCYKAAGGDAGTVYMLEYLRYNVRTSFDKAMEDAMRVFDATSDSVKMTNLCHSGSAFVAPNIEADYISALPEKTKHLNNLLTYFKNAKD